MRVVCSQCGTANTVEGPGLSGHGAVCRRCAAPLGVAGDDITTGAPPPVPSGGGHAWLDALGTPGDFDLGALADEPPPPPSPSADLSALSGQSGPARGTSKGLTGAFRFGADDHLAFDEATRLDGGAGPVNFDQRATPGDQDSTRVVAAPGSRPMARPAAQAAWRIKGDRGLIYEMQSVNAVVAWLEGKREIRAVQLAKADGPFKPYDQYPEIHKRLQKRPEPGRVELGTAADQPLTLDLSERPARPSEAPTRPARPADAVDGKPTRERRSTSARAAVTDDGALGFRTVLMVVLGSMALSAAAVAARLAVGDGATVAAPARVSRQALPPPSKALARAIAEYDAGHSTAAAQILEGLRETGDPRVERYLALVLHRTGRAREARAALERYRQSTLRVSGEHGRQVREVRH